MASVWGNGSSEEMEFGWQIVVGTIVGVFGAAFGSAGGVGGGGVFVPMLILIIGFDPKSSIAISKCMIMGTTLSADYYNLKRRHPTLDIPIIDYDLVLLVQPMLLLGISFGVSLSIIFPDWLLTVLFIIICLGTSARAFSMGIETWKKETMLKEETAEQLESTGCRSEQVEYTPLCDGPSRSEPNEDEENTKRREVTILENLYWKELGLLGFVWVAFLLLQIAKNNSKLFNGVLGVELVTDSSFGWGISVRGSEPLQGKESDSIYPRGRIKA